MSSQTLSQQEIDLLFSGGEAKPAPAPARQQKHDIQVYDFRRPNLISKEKLRGLEAMYGGLAKTLESWMSARVRGQIELQLEGVEQLSFGEFVLSLGNPCSSFVYEVSDCSQQAVIDFGRDFAFFIVDRLLGATGNPYVPERALTPLERMIVRIVADRVAEQLQEAWADHIRLTLKMSRFESMPDMLQAANREDPVLVANVTARVAGTESPLLLCLPFTVLEKHFSSSGKQRPRTTAESSPERRVERLAIDTTVRGVTLQATARTPVFTVQLADLAALVPGGVMQTGLAHNGEIILCIEDQPRFRGSAGRSGNALAVRIEESITSAADPAEQVRLPLQATRMNKEVSAGLPAGTENGAGVALSSLMSLSLPVIIELGRTRMTLHEITELGRGSVVQLDRLVGEPVDVIVGDRSFAEGEVVVLGEQFGVRITRIIAAGVTGQES
jgi:flagellar motor switch protein FliM